MDRIYELYLRSEMKMDPNKLCLTGDDKTIQAWFLKHWKLQAS